MNENYRMKRWNDESLVVVRVKDAEVFGNVSGDYQVKNVLIYGCKDSIEGDGHISLEVGRHFARYGYRVALTSGADLDLAKNANVVFVFRNHDELGSKLKKYDDKKVFVHKGSRTGLVDFVNEVGRGR